MEALLSKPQGATDRVGAVGWDLGINKGCSDMNLQLVFGRSGNMETGHRGHESAHRTIDMFARMKHCQYPPLIFHILLSDPRPGDPNSISVEQQTL